MLDTCLYAYGPVSILLIVISNTVLEIEKRLVLKHKNCLCSESRDHAGLAYKNEATLISSEATAGNDDAHMSNDSPTLSILLSMLLFRDLIGN